MCRTVHAVLQTLICGVQMLIRVLMTVLLMIENLIRMILQTLYNFISFMLQLLSLIPICVVFLVSARLKCFMCGGGGGCQPGRGGACDCIMSLLAIVILFFIFKSTGVMDKIFYSMGYAKAAFEAEPYVPTPGDITECSRNDTDQDIEYLVRTETYTASAETTAAKYLDSLVEDYIQTITTKPKFIIEPPEPESTYVPVTSKVLDMVITFTTPVVDGGTLLSIAATDIVAPAATEIVTDVVVTSLRTTSITEADEIITTKEVDTVALEATEIATDVVTSLGTTSITEADEIITTKAADTVALEAIEIATDVVTSLRTTSITEADEIINTKAVDTVALETTEIATDVVTSTFTPEALETVTTTSEATENLATTSENIITSDTTAAVDEVTTLVNEAVTSNANEVLDSLTPATKAPDMEMTDTSLNAATEAPDMGISDTPSNAEETTEITTGS